MRARQSSGALLCAVLCTAYLAAADAQVIGTVQQLPSKRPEAWAMNYFTSVTLFSGIGVPQRRAAGSFEAGVELGWVPSLSDSQRVVGFNGTKAEDLNKTPLFARPVATIGLPAQFSLTLSYVPPIRVFGLKAKLVALALERPLFQYGAISTGIRVYGQVGNTRGAITCWEDVVRFAPGSPQNPFGCLEKSNDKATQRYAGIELSGGYRIDALNGLMPFAAVSGNYLDPKVRVGSVIFGIRDRSLLKSDTFTFAANAGFVYPLDDRLTARVAVSYTPLHITRLPAAESRNDELLNVRAVLTYRFR